MDVEDICNRLRVATRQSISAQAAGSAALSIADMYQAADNFMSATLEAGGETPPRNHKAKLEAFLSALGEKYEENGGSVDELTELYDLWLKVRYEDVDASSTDVRRLKGAAESVEITALQHIAATWNQEYGELAAEIYDSVYGATFLSHEESVATIHEEYQWHAERLGEMGPGSKLGNKLVNPSNFCDLTMFADDDITREALVNDESVGRLVGNCYRALVEIAIKLRAHRTQSGVQLDDACDFTFGLRLQYRGQRLSEIADEFNTRMEQILSKHTEGGDDDAS